MPMKMSEENENDETSTALTEIRDFSQTVEWYLKYIYKLKN